MLVYGDMGSQNECPHVSTNDIIVFLHKHTKNTQKVEDPNRRVVCARHLMQNHTEQYFGCGIIYQLRRSISKPNEFNSGPFTARKKPGDNSITQWGSCAEPR